MQIKQKNTYFWLKYFNAFIFRETQNLQKTSQFEIFLQKCLFFKLCYLIFLDSLLRIYEYFVLTACMYCTHTLFDWANTEWTLICLKYLQSLITLGFNKLLKIKIRLNTIRWFCIGTSCYYTWSIWFICLYG